MLFSGGGDTVQDSTCEDIDFSQGHVALASACKHDIIYVGIMCILKTLLHGSQFTINSAGKLKLQPMELMLIVRILSGKSATIITIS